MARRNVFQRMLDAIGRLANLGGGAEEAPSPAPQEQPPTQYYQDFEPLPQQPPEPPVTGPTEVFVTEVTPIVPMGDNTEYIPGHMSGKNLRNPVYGRWRVTDPELGDVSDLINKVPQGRVTIVICGDLIVYAGYGIGAYQCKSYPFNTEDIQDMLDNQIDSQGNRIEFAQDLFNDLAINDEWGQITELNVLNKEDDPRG